MHVQQVSVHGEYFIGLFGISTDRYTILSRNFQKTSVLQTPVISTTLYSSNLIGLFCAGNSNGLILPYFIRDDEISSLKDKLLEDEIEINITRIPDECTALGNLISCNDKAAIVSPMISNIDKIEDALGVEVVCRDIAKHDEVGACCVATNKGFIVHPDAQDEIESISDILKVAGMVGSVNFGFPLVKSGLIANSNGYLAGQRTTGIELGRIDEALGFLD